MISRRIYMSITALMISVLILCMSLPHMKDGFNDYSVNQYTETAENYPSKANVYIPFQLGIEEFKDPEVEQSIQTTTVPHNLVTYIGDKNKLSQEVVSQWITYTKRNMAQYADLEAYQSNVTIKEISEMLVIEPTSINWLSDITFDILDNCLENGISLIFCGLPDLSIIKSSERVRNLLGIQSVETDEIKVDGLYLRSGFLLGGSTSYLEKTKEDKEDEPKEKVFPTETTLPWLTPANGTQVYMSGVFQDENTLKPKEAENNPMLIWRHAEKNGYVFVENSNFLSTPAGIGLLSAMAAEMNEYELYPVVNAQTLILSGFPTLTDENPEIMNELYSRSIKQVNQELMWPSISKFLQKHKYKATCMIAPQYDYLDDELPDEKLLNYYLKMFAEQSIETGLDGLSNSNVSLLEKLEMDEELFQENLDEYAIISFYGGDLEDEQIIQGIQSDILSSTRTVVRDKKDEVAAPLDFLSENVTAQNVLCEGTEEWTYKSDFLFRSMQTALGYTSINCDLSQITYPDENTQTWNELLDTMTSTLTAYGDLYSDFSKVTTAECDERIRQFLAMNFNQSRTGNQIEININNASGPLWFILRTHNEVVKEMEGGSFKELEKGAYLIEVTEPVATLTMGMTDKRFVVQ